MNINGPSPINSLQRPDEAAHLLRQNQRISAEVLQVAGDRVVLSLDGVRVVARLTSAELAASLTERRFANFIVKDNSGPVMVLQYVNPEHASNASTTGGTADLVPNLLRHAGQPVNGETVSMARALLQNGLPVQPEMIAEMRAALAGLPSWGAAEAQLAAALKAAGLAVNTASLELLRSDYPALLALTAELGAQLQDLQRKGLLPEHAQRMQRALELLGQMTLAWSDSSEEIAQELRRVAELLGKPVENELAQLAGDGPAEKAGHTKPAGLLQLAELRGLLSDSAPEALLENLDTLQDLLRRNQVQNAEPESAPLKGRWLRLDVPLAPDSPSQAQTSGLPAARICLACRDETGPARVDPANTRIVIQVDLAADESVTVDLSIAGQRIGARIATSSEALNDLASEELPGLQAGLEGLGLVVHALRCQVEAPERLPGDALPGSVTSSTWRSYHEISLEA